MKAAQGPRGVGGATLRNVTVDIHVWGGNVERVRSAAAPAVVADLSVVKVLLLRRSSHRQPLQVRTTSAPQPSQPDPLLCLSPRREGAALNPPV